MGSSADQGRILAQAGTGGEQAAPAIRIDTPPGTKNPRPDSAEVGPFERKSEVSLASYGGCKAMVDAPCATSAAAPACRCWSRADRFCLLARSAGVHVDFHADLHLNDFRSLPSHWGPPTSVGAVLTPELNLRRVRAQRKCETRQSSSTVADLTADTSLLDKKHFSLGQSTARYPNRSGA